MIDSVNNNAVISQFLSQVVDENGVGADFEPSLLSGTLLDTDKVANIQYQC